MKKYKLILKRSLNFYLNFFFCSHNDNKKDTITMYNLITFNFQLFKIK